VGSLLGLFVIVLIVLVWRYKRQRKAQFFNVKMLKIRPDEWEIDPRSLKMGVLVGKGAFGEVFQALRVEKGDSTGSTMLTVAVKKCSRRILTEDDLRVFVEELRILKKLSKQPHRNVGCVTSTAILYLCL
jgi:hypothetical protein